VERRKNRYPRNALTGQTPPRRRRNIGAPHMAPAIIDRVNQGNPPLALLPFPEGSPVLCPGRLSPEPPGIFFGRIERREYFYSYKYTNVRGCFRRDDFSPRNVSKL
jgi:hypothetical protein